MRLIAILPVYNEGKSIYNLIKKFNEISNVYQITLIVVNDNSIDDSKKWIQKAIDEYTGLNIHYEEHASNLGLAKALDTGFNYVFNIVKNEDLIVTMDGDNTHNPYLIKSMVDKILEGADIVIASRYCEQSRIYGLNKIRIYLSQGARYLYSFIWNIKGVKEYTCLFRVYRGNIIINTMNHFNTNFIEESGFTCVPEILKKSSLFSKIIVEVPMILIYSEKIGASNMKILKTIGQTLKLLIIK
jgi:dolichol-phosphate mannosyltransferase